MIQTFTRTLALVECGVASVTAPSEQVSGDRHLVKTIPQGALLAVVDGSGHGSDAARAARLAMDTLEAHPTDDLTSLFRRCHEQLKPTRGAVLSLATINGIYKTLTWLGVGNIEGIVLRNGSSTNGKTETLMLRPGVVGYRLPALEAHMTSIFPGDLIIFTTDGIRPDFRRTFQSDEEPRRIAEYISSTCCNGHDDGLVLVARYQGFGR